MNVELFVWQVVNYSNNNTVNNDCVGFLQTHAASLRFFHLLIFPVFQLKLLIFLFIYVYNMTFSSRLPKEFSLIISV